MASPVQLDLDAILRPISDSQPTGPDLREDPSPDSPFLDVKDARRNARAAERSLSNAPTRDRDASDTDSDEARAEAQARVIADDSWQRILDLAPTLIAERSKDLEVMAFWIEALTRVRGFAGLRDGLRATRVLVETFWDGLYPLPDAEDGVAARVAPLANLNGEGPDGPLPSRIALLPLTDAIDERGGFSTWHYGQARDLAKIADSDARAERERAGAVGMESFQAAVAATSTETLRDTLGDIEEALSEWEALSRAIAERASGYAPPASAVRDALSSSLDALRFAAKDKIAQESASVDALDAAGAAPVTGSETSGAPRGSAPGVIQSREDAFRALTAAAQYFRRTEPHSPISYGIEQCVRWGAMSLPELLRELVADESVRGQYFQRVGIREEQTSN